MQIQEIIDAVKSGAWKNSCLEVGRKVAKVWNADRKGKATIIGSALAVLVIGSCIFGSGDEFVNARTERFSSMLSKQAVSKDGDAFSHEKISSVQVLGVTESGVLVHYVSGTGDAFSNLLESYGDQLLEATGNSYDKVLHVKVRDGGYTDGAPLEAGVYVRDGVYSYENALGVVCSVEAYAQVTGAGELKRFQRAKEDVKRELAQKQKEKEEEQIRKEAEQAAAEAAKWERLRKEAAKELEYLDKIESKTQRLDEMTNRIKEMFSDKTFTKERSGSIGELKNKKKEMGNEKYARELMIMYLSWKKNRQLENKE